MTEYTLHLTLAGELRDLTITGDTPTELAAEVHRHARGQLGARRVDIHLNPETLTGTVRRAGADVGTFTLEPQADTAPAAPRRPVPTLPGEVRHGWTLDDIDRIAWGIVASDRWHRATPIDERYDHARYGIVIHLLSAAQPPAEYDLFDAGRVELNRAVHAEYRCSGRDDTARPDGSFGYMTTVLAYGTVRRSPFEDSVVERLAVHQVWPLLTEKQRAAVAALASCDDYARAAEDLQLDLGALDGRLKKGRRRFAAAWFEHETPPCRQQRDRRVSTRSGLDRLGRRRVTVSQLDQARQRYVAGELLREIAPDYGITPQALGALLRGDRQPAPDPGSEAAA